MKTLNLSTLVRWTIQIVVIGLIVFLAVISKSNI